MDTFSPKERLLRVLKKENVERPPVICPGGMMNAAIVDIMKKTGHTLPAAHHSYELMSELAYDVYQNTGFENFGIPFCMTVEAEVLGSSIDYGSLKCEPKIYKEAYPTVENVVFKPSGSMEKNERVGTVVSAIDKLSKKYPDIPAIGSITGPLSTSASLVEPMYFLKQLRRNKEETHRLVDYVCGHLIEYAKLMVENGADVISIADPTATGEILGPKLFAEYAVLYLNTICDAIHRLGVPVIIHICGEMSMVMPQLKDLKGDAISVDAFVNLKKLKEESSSITTMGNLSTYLLEFGDTEKIYLTAKNLLRDKVNIISPACGLSTSTPIENINAFTKAVTEEVNAHYIL